MKALRKNNSSIMTNDTIPGNRRASGRGKRPSWLTILSIIFLAFAVLGCENHTIPDVPPRPAYPVVDAADEIDDQDITTYLERKLSTDNGVRADTLAVSTREGVVTLSGRVDNILARERAARIAATVKGVRSVVNRMVVRPSERADRDIRADVLRTLAQDPVTEPWEVVVTVDSGIVTLSGSVDSWQERTLAENVASSVRGVHDLRNMLDIHAATLRTDAEIKEDVESALRWNAYIDDALITVDVEEGAVTLNGTIGSAYERSLAATTARVQGARSVNTDGLFVSWWVRDEMQREAWVQSRTDAEIEDAVEDALDYDPRVASADIDVRVTGGVVALTGTVDNVKSKRAAAQDAGHTAGVWQVDNLLDVRPAAPQPDAEVARQVRSALLTDPYVDKMEVRVSVEEGNVRLHGLVDSAFEKWQAEDVVARVPGVVSVENNLMAPGDVPLLGPFFYDWDPVLYDGAYTPIEKTDAEILAHTRNELFWSPIVEEDNVTVHVEDGLVTLTGTVRTWYARNTAAKKAFEAGATDVENNLHVEYTSEAPTSPENESL